MKLIKPAIIVMILVVVTTLLAKQRNTGTSKYPEDSWRICAAIGEYCGHIAGYRIEVGKTPEELKNRVCDILKESDCDWRPFGGVSCDPNKQQYLQVMVHPRRSEGS
jgi:hypothetical protein